jgi:Protein of unknown function (DUF2490)
MRTIFDPNRMAILQHHQAKIRLSDTHMISKILLLLPVILIINFQVFAQTKQTTHQGLYWTRYYNQLIFNVKFTWHNEIDNRTFFEKNKHHQLIAHTRLHYKLSKNKDLALGLAYALQNPHDPNSVSTLVVPEIRPYQEFNYSSPVKAKLSIQQRFRIDERFVRKNNGKELSADYNFNFRFRYRFQITYKVSKPEKTKPTILKFAEEIMVNAGGNILYNQFDQNRLYFAVEQVFNKKISLELGYLKWYQQRSSGYQFFDRDILRLTLYHKIKL